MRAIALVFLAVPSAAFVAPVAPNQAAARVPALSAGGASWAKDGVPDRAFGCELEFLCNNHRGSVHDIQQVVDEVADEPIYVYGEPTRKASKAWKLVPDASLPAGTGYELVSPILRGSEGRARLARTLEAINAYDLVGVDRRCGYHVHIDLTGIDFEGLKRICQNWVKYEDAIDLILPDSRREDNNKYARSIRENFNFENRYNKQANDRIAKAKNLRALHDLMNPIRDDPDDPFYSDDYYYNPEGRYYKARAKGGA